MDDARQGTPRPDRKQSLRPGAEFGRYQIKGVLGEGGMGTVYLAHDPHLKREVALKIPKFEPEDSEGRKRFVREARTAGSMQHAGICSVFDVGSIDGQMFLTMPVIEGAPLSRWCAPKNLMSSRRAAKIVRDIAAALSAAHRAGIVHRDLKPDNVMVDKRGQPIIMDFGLARSFVDAGQSRVTSSGIIVGSPAYMAPEQIRGELESIGPATDVYGLGVILYELLTGGPPFDGNVAVVMAKVLTEAPPSPRSVLESADKNLEAICLKMMAKEPGDRFSSAQDVANVLTAYLGNRFDPESFDSEPTVSETSRVARPTAVSSRRHAAGVQLKTLAIGFLLGILTLGVAALIVRSFSRVPARPLSDAEPADPSATPSRPAEEAPVAQEPGSNLTPDSGAAAPLQPLPRPQPAASRKPLSLAELNLLPVEELIATAERGPIARAANAPPAVSGFRFVIVRGVVPHARQVRAIAEAGGVLPSEMTGRVHYVDFQLERQQAHLGPNPWNGPWEPIDVTVAANVLQSVSLHQTDVVNVAAIDPVCTMPLPALVSPELSIKNPWGKLASHPLLEATEQIDIAIGSRKLAAEVADSLLFRYIDFDVQPGNAYRYRTRILVQVSERASDGESPLSDALPSKWTTTSAASPGAVVPSDAEFFLSQVIPQRGKNLPAARCEIFEWDRASGADASATATIGPGGRIQGMVRDVVLPPGELSPDERLVSADGTVIDTFTNDTVGFYGGSFHPDLKVLEGQHAVRWPQFALVANRFGELNAIDTASRTTEQALARVRYQGNQDAWRDSAIRGKTPAGGGSTPPR